MAIEIVDFPMKNGGFNHSHICHSQRINAAPSSLAQDFWWSPCTKKLSQSSNGSLSGGETTTCIFVTQQALVIMLIIPHS